jgi:uncharacterized cupredoxin-like copper-binding protein
VKKTLSLGIAAAIVLCFGVAVTAQQAKTPPAKKAAAKVQVPAAITTAFEKAFPTATIKNVAKETEDGKTVYEVESVDKGLNRDLIYNPDGTVVEMEEQVNPADLPAPVADALKKLYPKATITKAEKLMKGQTLTYEMALKGAAKSSVEFTPEGKVVTPVPEKPEPKKPPVKK